MTTTEAALRNALQNPQLDAALLRILQGGQGLGDAEKFAFRALRDCIATLATVGQDGGPFHVSRSSDGEKEWFSARDAAAGVSIPAKCRDDAYALVASLNRSCVTYAALSQPSPASSTVGEIARFVSKMEPLGPEFEKVWDDNADELYEGVSSPSSGEPASVAVEAEARLLDIAAERAAQIRSSCFDYCTGDCNCAQAAESAVDEMERLVAALAEPASPAPVGEQGAVEHWSDCAIHNEPAMPNGPCDCGGYTPLKAWRVLALEAIESVQSACRETNWGQPTFGLSEGERLERRAKSLDAAATPATTTTERGRG